MSTVVRGARVFDGERVLDAADVLIAEGRIASVGRDLTGDEVVDAEGCTLLPGLVDCHVHVWERRQLEQALVFGVTTVLDMAGHAGELAARKAEQSRGGANDRADMFGAGPAVTAPGGHGTQFGFEVPTIEGPDEAEEAVERRIRDGSDFIKIIVEPGRRVSVPTLSPETVHAAVAAARARGKLAVVHVCTYEDTLMVLDARPHALVHLFNDREPDDRLDAKTGDTFVVPTLSVMHSGAASRITADPDLLELLSPADLTMLGRAPFHDPATSPAGAAIRRLRALGVPILAGTDAGNPGTLWGASLHGELELLVRAGLSPPEALAGATGLAADRFGLVDRGRIAPGRRADLVLVRGNPLEDVRATRRIVSVWKGGVLVNRAPWREEARRLRVLDDERRAAAPPQGFGDGLVADFEDGTLSARFGSGWTTSTDAILGGNSTVELAVVEGGAAGSRYALEISGVIGDLAPFARWAGAMFAPGDAPNGPANLSATPRLRFMARGDGRPAQLNVYSVAMVRPVGTSFLPGADWEEHVVDVRHLGLEGHDVRGVLFSGGMEPGEFRFYIDDVRFE